MQPTFAGLRTTQREEAAPRVDRARGSSVAPRARVSRGRTATADTRVGQAPFERSRSPRKVAQKLFASLMFPKVFPTGVKTAPGEVSEGRFTW